MPALSQTGSSGRRFGMTNETSIPVTRDLSCGPGFSIEASLECRNGAAALAISSRRLTVTFGSAHYPKHVVEGQFTTALRSLKQRSCALVTRAFGATRWITAHTAFEGASPLLR